ncbi:MAG: putative CoA-binding protein [Halieaceae bacterium]|jgi:predicted CoA-binding protein
MPLIDDVAIADILRSVNTVALLGASHRAERPSYGVMRFLLRRGCRVYPVNPGLAGRKLLGQQVYARLADLPETVDMVDVFRNAAHLPTIVEETILCQIGILWTQLGVIDHAAAQRAEDQGIRVVMDRCPAIEWPRLQRSGLL